MKQRNKMHVLKNYTGILTLYVLNGIYSHGVGSIVVRQTRHIKNPVCFLPQQILTKLAKKTHFNFSFRRCIINRIEMWDIKREISES